MTSTSLGPCPSGPDLLSWEEGVPEVLDKKVIVLSVLFFILLVAELYSWLV
jgi:preprotein translocase subunit SecG